MTSKEYPYITISPDHGDDVIGPMVPVVIKYGNKQVRVNALVDSGTQYSIIDAEIAENLGIDLETCDKDNLTGIKGGTNLTPLKKLSLEIPDFKATITITAFFVKDLPTTILVGQEDFFQYFDVFFQAKQYKFTLSEAD